MKRRDLVQSLLSAEPQTPLAAATASKPRVPSGAVRAMGLELARLGDEAQQATRLREQIAAGDAVIDLDPALLERSFVSDRLARNDDADYRKLVDSMRESGQQVPILARPHPQAPGQYQIAFGHRRRDAAAELGIAVRAIVRPLSDQELVVAQGKENAERRDLSFVERAMFAAAMERRGFSRAVINASLGVLTSETTRLLAVAASVPGELVAAIGPAPKIGRPRWMELVQLLARQGALDEARDIAARPSFAGVSSDRRFEMIYAALKDASQRDHVYEFRNRHGALVIKAERFSRVLRLTVDERLAPGVGERLLHLLPGVVREQETE